jgi:hypothetical protein
VALVVTRLDVSRVPLQGSYVAKRCPVRAQNDHDPVLAGREVPLSDAQRARIDAGIEFEAHVFEALLGTLDGDAVLVTERDREIAQSATLEAMRAGVRVVLGGWLPDDLEARRVGRPDILVRVDDAAEAGYVPVDVKSHLLAGRVAGGWLVASQLDTPDPAHADWVEGRGFRRDHLLGDAFQLAHYWRMLEQHAFTPLGGSAVGGIIDRDPDGGLRVWWIDLTESRWKVWWSETPVSVMERYDHEFAFRLDVIAHALARLQDPTLDRKVTPVRIGECGACPWRAVCFEELEAADHISLLPRSTWARFVEHRRRGVFTRRQLAALDWTTATAIFGPEPGGARLDIAAVVEAAAALAPETPLADMVDSPKVAVLRRLADLDIVNVADLARLDPETLRYSGAQVGWLPGLIDEARAATSGRAYRARGIERIGVSRGDVEVDLDMENTEDGCVYLWGLLTTVRQPLGRFRPRGPFSPRRMAEGYTPVVSWIPLDEDLEAELFGAFWRQLMMTWANARRSNRTFRVYCYTSAERTQIRRIAASDARRRPSLDEVDAFIDSSPWVDLHRVFTSQVITGSGAGLKTTAALAGFAWRDDDPGGEQSMAWYTQATTHPDEAVRAASRARILAYNEDDVHATYALREWLDTSVLSSIDEWT